MNENITNVHYDSKYFEYQKPIGEFNGIVNSMLFSEFIKSQDEVLDFGCGGGYILKNLVCKKKVGVEINPTAAATAKENRIEVFSSVDEIPDNYVDVIISHHALEHCLNPLNELQKLHKVLKVGGKFILVVPCESIRWKYKTDDIDQHLYTWSPMCIGNLCKLAGFSIIESKPYIHQGMSLSTRKKIIKCFGWRFYHIICRIYGLVWPVYQVRVIGEKK